MATETQKALLTAIEKRAFAPSYLFVGDDDFRKNEALALFLSAAVDPATRDFNLEVRRGADISPESLGSVLKTPPMLADRRVVVIKDAGSLKKETRPVVEEYLDRPSPDVILVLVQSGGEKTDPVFGKATTVVFEPISGPKLSRWIVNRAEVAFGTTITAGAVELLQGSVGNDLSHLNTELEKLASLRNGAAIDEEAVASVVGVRREESLPALLDAIAARDAAAALKILPGLLEQPKSSGVFVVMVLGMQILGIGFARARLARRVPPGRLQGELIAMIKESGAYPGRAWGDAASTWMRVAPQWSDEDLRTAAATLHAADRALKETGFTSEEGILQTVIMSMCKAKTRQAA